MTQSNFSGIEPQTRAFLQSLADQGGPPISTLPLAEARRVFASLQSSPVPAPATDIEDRTFPGGPQGEVSVRIIRPQGSQGPLPVVMYFPGGGWVLGSKQTHERLVREIAAGAQAAVVFVDYTSAPEAHYPVAIEEAYAATCWVAENGPKIGLDSTRLAVSGDSVGGNMAIAVTMLAKEHGGPKICFQSLFYPVTSAGMDTGSYQQFAEGHFLTHESMKWFWDSYAPDVTTRMQLTASPLLATVDQVRGLPPAVIITAECDVLRDEGEAYAHKLMDAGVRVTATRYLGTIHDFVLLNPLAGSPAPVGAIAEATNALRKAFSTKS